LLLVYSSDSVATRGRAQGQAVIEYLGKRPAMKNKSLVGSVTAASRFEDTRKHLVDRLSTVVESILKSDQDELDKKRLVGELKQIVLLSSTLHVMALCSGLSIYFLHLVDAMVGWMVVSLLLGGGGATYMFGTVSIAQTYQQQCQQRADRLEHAWAYISDKELDRVNRRIMEGVAPYTRYVESEQQRIGCQRALQQFYP
jgi:hypothetical protein